MKHLTRKQRKLFYRILVAGVIFLPLFLIGHTPMGELWHFHDWPLYVTLPLFSVPYLIAGYDVLRKAVLNIFHGRIFDENFLMCIATVGAFFAGAYAEAGEVMLLYQVGELLQGIAVGKSRRSVTALMDIRPDYANVERDGALLQVSPEEVEPGEIIVIKPGEKVPLDCVILSGKTNVDTATLTGEAMPRDLAEGDEMVSGCVNMSGMVKCRTTKPYGESTVAKILELVENASFAKAKSENFITRFAKYYTPAVVIIALLLGAVPPVFFGEDVYKWVMLALTCLVVSCPCALVISVPLTFFGGIGGAAKRGILIKGANHIEELARVETVVFDKTGTLTSGTFTVTVIHPDSMTEEELLYLAAAAECYSDHPISRSLAQAYKKEIDRTKVFSVKELPGKGVHADIDGLDVLVGNRALMEEFGVAVTECHHHHLGTVVHVGVNGCYAGHVEINDQVKPDAERTIRALKPRNTVILTGDRESVGKEVAARLQVDEVHCGLLPAEKVEKVEALLAEKPKGSALAFVGDGINDAPVLSRADVGIAMGALGSDAAIEAADVVLMDDKPLGVATAIRCAKKTKRIVWQNVIFSLTVKVGVLIFEIATAFTAHGHMEQGHNHMGLAAFADVGVLVLAVLNATRALRVPKDPK